MPSEVTMEVSLSEVTQAYLAQLVTLTPTVREEEREVQFLDYWGNTHALVKIVETEGFVSGCLDETFGPTQILIDNYGAKEDVVQEAIAAWIGAFQGSKKLPPSSVWDILQEG